MVFIDIFSSSYFKKIIIKRLPWLRWRRSVQNGNGFVLKVADCIPLIKFQMCSVKNIMRRVDCFSVRMKNQRIKASKRRTDHSKERPKVFNKNKIIIEERKMKNMKNSFKTDKINYIVQHSLLYSSAVHTH